ncbi:hypothetical protein VTG60DRAFT_1162 [Thermothelomyces hinnuleus]
MRQLWDEMKRAEINGGTVSTVPWQRWWRRPSRAPVPRGRRTTTPPPHLWATAAAADLPVRHTILHTTYRPAKCGIRTRAATSWRRGTPSRLPRRPLPTASLRTGSRRRLKQSRSLVDNVSPATRSLTGRMCNIADAIRNDYELHTLEGRRPLAVPRLCMHISWGYGAVPQKPGTSHRGLSQGHLSTSPQEPKDRRVCA